MNSPARKTLYIAKTLGCSSALFAILVCAAICAGSGSAWAQERYDDHELTDRFYITLGGYSQTDIRTTIRIDAKSTDGAIALGTVIGLESLFDLDDKVSTTRLDGWYRFGKKHRIGWNYFSTDREGLSIYNQNERIEIGDLVIEPGDGVSTDDKSKLWAVSWSYSFVNTSKYEAWFGVGLNFQKIDTTIDVTLGGKSGQLQEEAKATIPIPTLNFGGRWDFNERWRMLLMSQYFGIKIGDYSGKLRNTRLLAEFNITPHFGLGGGLEAFSFEAEAEGDNFLGQLDSSYTAFILYLKGQI